jgi:endonuclease/exonuclease/phosphatase family metal-dependent hydrolase
VVEVAAWIERYPRVALAIVLAASCGALAWAWPDEDAIATFNIENFPRSDRQIERAFELIAEMDASIVGVQEIRDPDRFAREARARLGDSWRVVYADGPHAQKVGVLYDASERSLDWAQTHRETLIGRRAKPVLEARFDDGLRVFVVHLTSGARNVERRGAQLAAIETPVREAVRAGDRVLVIGDFNASQPEDRESIAGFAARTGLVWSSEHLACTSYWDRRDGCVGTPLDHVLSWRAIDVEARGACATHGCDRTDRCPEYCAHVSDHCPVHAALP